MKTFHIKTWGCQMNYCDTDMIKQNLTSLGLKEVESFEEADVAVLNTCSVRQKAEDKVAGIGRRLIGIKKNNPSFKVVMTGCMAQRFDRKRDVNNEFYVLKMKKKFDWVDYFVPIGDIGNFFKITTGNKMQLSSDIGIVQDIIGYVPISTGCNNFCSYCVVPYSRGKEISFDFKLIESKIKALVDSGSKIVILLGQNVNSWTGKIDGKSSSFPDLLDKISKEFSSAWISFLTSHPKDFNSKLIRVMKENKNICRYLNLPIQSGSDEILRKMNRKYTRSEYLNKINLLRKEIPNIRLSTDIIVGFPGENKKSFSDTVNLVKDANFSMAYISEYSPRPGTPGYVFGDDIPAGIKKRRKEIITDLVMKNARDFNGRFVGKTMEIVVTGINSGKTFDLTDVRLKNKSGCRIGDRKNVLVKGYSECGLVA